VTSDFETRYSFNTAIASIMELVNSIPESFKQNDVSSSNKFCLNEAIVIILKTLNPISPHISQHLWKGFYSDFSKEDIESSWPILREDLLEVSEFNLIVQVNGKVRGKIVIDKNLEQEKIESIALNIENVASTISDTPIKKIIYIKEKIINFVI
jgi:leucyl-tRNA synthetase